ncbi:MAG: hypothetical protein U0P45_06735 [Acidimicrobiales bacterium]
MSDTSQGPGWWQASDGKWYPPEQAPGAAPQPGAPQPGYGAPQPGYGAPQPGMAGPGGVGVGDALGYGWKKFQEHVGTIIVAVIIYVVAVGVFSFIGNIVQSQINSIFGSLIFTIIQLVVSSALSIIIIRFSLAIVDGKPLNNETLFSTDNLVPFIIASVLFSIAVTIGLILCVIPGIVIAFLGWYFGFFLVDKGLEPVEAIKASIDFTKDNVGTLLVWAIVAFIVTAIGYALCCVGALVAVPVVYLGTAFLYRRLQGQPVAP